MKDAVRGNPELTRQINRRLVLNLVKKYGPISRANLSRRSGLSAPTVSSIVDGLLKDHYLRELGLGDSKGGRRPILLTLDENYYCFVGVSITPIKITVALTNIKLDILAMHEIQIDMYIPKEELMTQVSSGLRELFQRYPVKKERVLGIGVSTPGRVNVKEGRVVDSFTIPNWKDVPVVAGIEREWEIRTYIEHNVKAAALWGLWVGGDYERNLIVMKVGYGIGAGIVINGKIFRGVTGNSGELGHTKIQADGPICRCGSVGCYESLADLNAIERMMRERHPDFNGNYEDVFHLVEEGSVDALEVVKKVSHFLARGMINIIHLFNLPLILIVGEIAPYWHLCAPYVSDYLNEHVLKVLQKTVEIKVVGPEHDAEVEGAAAIVLDQEFQLSV